MYYERIDNKGLGLTWFEAREQCQLKPGMDLASIRTNYEWQEFRKILYIEENVYVISWFGAN